MGAVLNPYKINEPAVVSFSGGRSSAYMLYKILEANNSWPEDLLCLFSNTGLEMEETLFFVQKVHESWGVPITWLELAELENIGTKDKPKYIRHPKVVTFETASRKGEPFWKLLKTMDAIPNRVARTCTVNLKIRTMSAYSRLQGYESPWLQIVGIRGDEPSRAVKLHGVINEGQETYCPLYVDGVTAKEVGDFWAANNFDLDLPNNNGTTPLGNCTLCFLKGRSKRLSIIRERPSLADPWIEMEEYKQQQFCRDEASYKEMKVFATSQGNLFDFGDDETIPCFCGD